MPKQEYELIEAIKTRMIQMGQPAKKSEILRAGLLYLNSKTNDALKLAIETLPMIKTGRPKKGNG